jgi:uncharacterized protein (TIGR02757 family)
MEDNSRIQRFLQRAYIHYKADNNSFDPDIKEFLEQKVSQYNTPEFIESDPVQVPHQFSLKEDKEISGFLSASIAWGNRRMIIRNALKLVSLMGSSPYDFVLNHHESHLDAIDCFVHRTFNAVDARYFICSLRNIYLNHGGLEGIFTRYSTPATVFPAIQKFNQVFFELPHPERTLRHVSNPAKGSAAKRINMFLRWMVRDDSRGVDFGLWKGISTSALSCPLDVHSGNVARKLGLLNRKQNDYMSVFELDSKLRAMDAEDPVKYDFALFGLGIFEKF